MSVPINFVDKVNDWEKTKYEEGYGYRKDLKPGDATWLVDGPRRFLYFVCPCGCGTVMAPPVKNEHMDGWDWDGSEDKPTLSPSIRSCAPCGWHGYLRGGDFVQA